MKLFAHVIVSMAIVAIDIFYIEAKPSIIILILENRH